MILNDKNFSIIILYNTKPKLNSNENSPETREIGTSGKPWCQECSQFFSMMNWFFGIQFFHSSSIIDQIRLFRELNDQNWSDLIKFDWITFEMTAVLFQWSGFSTEIVRNFEGKKFLVDFLNFSTKSPLFISVQR